MRFTVGGEFYEFNPEDVERLMRDVKPELHQKYVVEIDDRQFPPKQVFAAMSGRERQTFTTMEAQRVLTRLGFVCREADQPGFVRFRPRPEFMTQPGAEDAQELDVANDLVTIKLAIAELSRRVAALEDERPV